MAANAVPLRLVARPPAERPVLLFDGDCAFCCAWAEHWRIAAGDRIDFAASQTVGGRFPEISPADLERAVHLISPTGQVYSGAGAILRVRSLAIQRTWWQSAYESVPGVAAVAELVYRFIARHRKSLAWFPRHS